MLGLVSPCRTMSTMRSSRPLMDLAISRLVPCLLIILVLGYYAAFIYQHAVNIPRGCDVFDVLKVVSDIDQAPDPSSVVARLFKQHNEHRTLSSRLVYSGLYFLQDEINFRTLVIIANLTLPLIQARVMPRRRTKRLSSDSVAAFGRRADEAGA